MIEFVADETLGRSPHLGFVRCPTCGGAGRVPDPDFTGFRAVYHLQDGTEYGQVKETVEEAFTSFDPWDSYSVVGPGGLVVAFVHQNAENRTDSKVRVHPRYLKRVERHYKKWRKTRDRKG